MGRKHFCKLIFGSLMNYDLKPHFSVDLDRVCFNKIWSFTKIYIILKIRKTHIE